MNRKTTKLSNLILLNILFSIGISTNIITQGSLTINCSSTPSIINGWVDGDFGEKGTTTFSFRGWFPSDWNNTYPIPLEYSYDFHDQSVNRNINYKLSFIIDLFNSENILSYHDVLTVFNYTNTGYEFFDQFTKKCTWDLSTMDTGLISAGETWIGIVYMAGEVSLNSVIYSNSSNKYNITYVNKILPSKQINSDITSPILAIAIMVLISQKKKEIM